MQVWPKNSQMRKILKHANGLGFQEEGPADWPDDSFTARRVADGDVLLEEPEARREETSQPQPSGPETSQSPQAAETPQPSPSSEADVVIEPKGK